MTWIIYVAAFLIGAAAGALLFRTFKSDEAKVKSLEAQLQKLSEEHENYKTNVHTHFSNSARLLNEMTDSYRNVYQHLATGAQTLCPDYISSQLSITGDTKALLGSGSDTGTPNYSGSSPASESAAPLDYVPKSSADRKGSLAEDYGIEKENETQG